MTDHTEFYPTPAELDYSKNRDHYAHGVAGHSGWRCGDCAREAVNVTKVAVHGVDYWQNQQIAWQEECDKLQVEFDVRVADHFPEHLPQNCELCPSAPIMPAKPFPPVERALTQLKKNEA